MTQQNSKTFAHQMQSLLGPAYDAFVNSQTQSPHSAIRINTLKTTSESVMTTLETAYAPVPWCPTGTYIPDGYRPGKSPLYHAGAFYIQEPSAMSAAQSLGVLPGDKVLDLCAAPGGKSTHLAALLNGSGLLVCNDISPSRAKALVKNLELFGVTNSVVVCEQPHKLAVRFAGFFDKILIDAPCSGEGMFRKDKDVARSWSPERPAEFAALQKDILHNASTMLAKGGKILYSTCTFNTQENEDVIEAFLGTHPSFALSEISYPFSPGLKGLTSCKRLWPHELRGEGHFLALLQNTSSPASQEATPKASYPAPTKSQSSLLSAFTSSTLTAPLPHDSLALLGYVLYLLPQVPLPSLNGIRTLKMGVRLGDFLKQRFEPCQAFASMMLPHQVQHHLELPPSSEEVLRYLKGETLTTPPSSPATNGYVLVTTHGLGLGWGKLLNGTLKNKYNKHWLMR